jgi:NAD(P)-dependent dehydrogenase (short-subunit alcohol dehydrogenase family)
MAECVLITGSGRGIGLALAEEFARLGYRVFAGARSPQRPGLETLARNSSNVTPLSLDVRDSATIAGAAAVLGNEGVLDILVNNAAIFPGEGNEPFERVNPDWFNGAFDTNVTGVARVTRGFLPLLRKSACARIVNISSGAGSISEKEDFAYYPYSVSKAALNMLTRALAAEFRPGGIVVAAISPGWVRTEMGGPGAPLTARESAAALVKTIAGLSIEQTGKFLGRNGEPYAW